MDLEDRLERAENVEKIRNLKARYCDLCDEGYDADGLCDLFTEDGVWDGGSLGVFKGRENLHNFFSKLPETLSLAIHHVTNSSILISDDGLSAEARWYLIQMATLKRGNQAVWLTGRYVDQIVLREGSWNFRHVSLKARFFSPYDKGWAEVPFMDLAR